MISVIIPAYNSSSFIKRAVDSVLNQIYTDLELIIVDDCSTDDTYEICKAYTDPRIRVVKNEVNQGAGVSRQVGLREAKGEFITFLDSDDFLMPDFLSVSMLLQQQHNSDVVYTSFTIMYPQGLRQVIPAGDFIMENSATVQCHFNSKLKFLTGKLFRRELLDKVHFSNKRVGEDVQTLFYATYLADRVRSSSYSGYVHVFREGSLLANAPHFFCYCESTKTSFEILEFLDEHNEKEIFNYILASEYNNFTLVKQAIKDGKFDKAEVQKNRQSWTEIKNWFRDHSDRVKSIKL